MSRCDLKFFDGELLLAETDEAGQQKTYSYDGFKRLQTMTIKGYGGQPDQVISLTYDASRRTLSVTTNAPSLSAGEAWAYDIGGRLTNHVDSSGVAVSISYSADGQTTTTNYPGGITIVQHQPADRRPESLQGNGVVAKFYSFSRSPSDSIIIGFTATNRLGAADSPRWQSQHADYTGTITSEDRPLLAGSANVLTKYYDNASYYGWPSGISYSAGFPSVAIRHDLYANVSFLMTNLTDNIPTGYERTLQIDRFFTQINNNTWYYATTNYVFLTDGSDQQTMSSIVLEQQNNFEPDVMSRTIQFDADTNQTITTTYVDRTQDKVTVVTSQPATSSLSASNVIQSGLLMQSSTLSVASPTRFYNDALGRTNQIKDSLGFSSYITYDPVHGWLTSVTDPAGHTTSFDYYWVTEANAGKVKRQTDPTGKKTYYSYTRRGELYHVWGDVPYPAEYNYSKYGELTNLVTFRGGAGWNLSSWPVTPGAGDNTYWTYDAASGALLEKKDAEARKVTYAYEPLTGKLLSRAWQRTVGGNPVSVTNVYSEDDFADLAGLKYSDGTPPVWFGNFNRAGVPREIVDGSGTNELTYDYAGRMVNTTNVAGLLIGTGITNHFSPAFGRDTLTVVGPNWRLTDSFGYDGYGRMSNVAYGNFNAAYGYLPNSDLLQTTTCKSNSTTVLITTRAWEYGMRLGAILNQVDNTIVTSHGYTYDSLNRRRKASLEDGSIWKYEYNDRNELTGARRFWPDWSTVTGQRFGYAYDNVGNRTSANFGGDANGANLQTISYTANDLNQYASITTPGYKEIVGVALAANSVTVNGGTADRKQEYFHREISTNNSTGPVWLGATASSGGTNITGGCVVPKNQQALTNDLDGNLIFDGMWNYEWDAENRLRSMSMTNVSNIPTGNRVKLDFVYDYMGRRVQKVVSTWNGSFGSPVTNRFVYDGWNLLAILASDLSPLSSFMWGQDLSGTMAEAGGIGGLLLVNA